MPIFNMVSGSGGYEKIISGTIVIDSNVSFDSRSNSFFIVFNKELYASIRNSLYKVNIIDNEGELTKVTDFPYNSDYSGFYPVVYKNEIHFFGGYNAPDRYGYHFSWDGEKLKFLIICREQFLMTIRLLLYLMMRFIISTLIIESIINILMVNGLTWTKIPS